MAICPKRDATYLLELTEDEVYTLQIILGHVAGDKQASTVTGKLDRLMGDVDCEDYARVSFSVEDGDDVIRIV